MARPYTVTGGRTRPRGERQFDLIDIVVATGAEAAPGVLLSGPEHRQILSLVRRHGRRWSTDLRQAVGLPLGLVRVLLADLLYEDQISLSRQAQRTDRRLLQKVLDSLRAL